MSVRVIVVGAGPAGSSAAYHLSRSGHAVRLYDQSAFPRDKICGDAVSPRAVQAMAFMGVSPRDLAGAAAVAIDGCVLGAPGGAANVGSIDLSARCLPRAALDHLLFARALAAGAVFERRRVFDLAPLCAEADWVIDARGVYAGDANGIAMRAYWRVPTAGLAANARTKLQIYFQRFLGAAYGWIFPVGEGQGLTCFNVGVGLWREDFKKNGQTLTALFERFVGEDPRAQALAAAAAQRERPKGCYLAAAKRDNRVAAGQVLKIGDAANLTDPVTGEGIQNAILSGFLVAQAINTSREPALAAAMWQRIYEDRFESHFRAGLRASRLLRPRWVKNRLIAAMNRHPGVSEQINAAIFDMVRYHELAGALFGAMRAPRRRELASPAPYQGDGP